MELEISYKHLWQSATQSFALFTILLDTISVMDAKLRFLRRPIGPHSRTRLNAI